jgi:hypothetical protein
MTTGDTHALRFCFWRSLSTWTQGNCREHELQTGLDATDMHPVNIFHFCTMVEARNNKQFLSEIMAPVCVAL